MTSSISRRLFLAAPALGPLARAAAFTGAPPPSKMGIATTSYIAWKPMDTLDFLEHCHALGAAGIQSALTGDLERLRARAQQLGMYIQAIVPLPDAQDTAPFEKGLQDAQKVGAICVRTRCLAGRRYENFNTYAEWQQFVAKSNASLKAILPLLDRYKIRLALENHKDWTADEMLVVLQTHSNEYLGVCLDFGNNFSLLDNPMATAVKLAPFAFAVHIKDLGVEEDPDGFLMSEVALGEGFLNLPAMLALVRKAHPETRITLEMITRNPLKVTCLTEKYWVTFPDRNGGYLARTLKTVQKEGHQLQILPRITGLSPAALLSLEDENVKACLNHGREKLDL